MKGRLKAGIRSPPRRQERQELQQRITPQEQHPKGSGSNQESSSDPSYWHRNILSFIFSWRSWRLGGKTTLNFLRLGGKTLLQKEFP
jgi:hypothetical protein